MRLQWDKLAFSSLFTTLAITAGFTVERWFWERSISFKLTFSLRTSKVCSAWLSVILQSTMLAVVDGSSHVGTGNSGQGGSPEKEVANRGGGGCKGGEEGKQVESSKVAVGQLQPGQPVQGELLEVNSRHKAEVVLGQCKLPHLLKLD